MLDNLNPPCYYMQAIEIAHAPVAQLDRVTDYESVGQGFESLLAYQLPEPQGSGSFLFFNRELSKNPDFAKSKASLV